jgi:hypothetical protein
MNWAIRRACLGVVPAPIWLISHQKCRVSWVVIIPSYPALIVWLLVRERIRGIPCEYCAICWGEGWRSCLSISILLVFALKVNPHHEISLSLGWRRLSRLKKSRQFSEVQLVNLEIGLRLSEPKIRLYPCCLLRYQILRDNIISPPATRYTSNNFGIYFQIQKEKDFGGWEFSFSEEKGILSIIPIMMASTRRIREVKRSCCFIVIRIA